MTRPKRPKLSVPSQADLRQKADAKYRMKPEVREKNKLRMAEKRAVAKLRRWKWDPPKAAKNNSEALLTPAEHLALAVLTGMRQNENSIPAEPPVSDAESPVQLRSVPPKPLESDLIGDREESPTRGSSVAAVLEHPILEPAPCDIWVTKRHKPLPRYVTPETPLQKQMRRELGAIGPLTPVQVAQIKTVKLARPSRRFHEEAEPSDLNRGAPFLSSARQEHIHWDSPVEGEFGLEQAGGISHVADEYNPKWVYKVVLRTLVVPYVASDAEIWTYKNDSIKRIAPGSARTS
ncbi:hypothetical protein B0H14DRAFT_2577839 [Mycena olivaceomarginata]|nr:hypothetical protein B0H14DRAFT_2577839 [Mycena olivaceomarginata]